MNKNPISRFALTFQSCGLLCSRVVVSILAGCALMMLAGCVSSGEIKNASPISSSVSITRDQALVETSSSVADPDGQAKLLNALIISGLQEAQKFGRVSGNKDAINPGGGIEINVEIKELFGVSDAARVLFGGLAGRADILVHVTVSDLKSGNQIEAFDAEGKSSAGTAMSGTTSQAVQRAADQVVAEIVKISQQS
jgi:hypothetical protein